MKKQLTFGSLFAGIGGFDLGFERAGMSCEWQVEIEKSCRSVLAGRFESQQFEDVSLVGTNELSRVNVICGGFPCQDLSVAGRRAGLSGERSGLFFEFMRIVDELSPHWVCIENVPGLLSSNGGRDMGTVLGTLGQLGYGYAYRVLDAQWFGVAQRRRRVFIVGCLGDWRSAAEVLFERESLPWDSPPSRKAGADVADPTARSFAKHCGASGGKDSCPRNAVVTHTLGTEGHDASEDGTGRGTPLVPVAFSSKDHGADAGELAPTLRSMNFDKSHMNGGGQAAVAYQCHGSNVGPMGHLRRGHGDVQSGVPFIEQPKMRVRRLTPTECERLQGFPDAWTEGHSDSPRYRMIGNAVAVPCAEWIARRIAKQ